MSEDNQELQDAKDFVEAAATRKENDGNRPPPALSGLEESEETGKDEDVTPGRVVQYSLYKDGYAPTTPTVKSLPPGCYDIMADNRCVYVVPTLPPTGILLELPDLRSEEVIRVANTFWDSEKDYKEGNEFVIGGAAYKAGVMIFGPPGSGKSCTIKLLNKKLIERGGTVFYGDTHPKHIMSFLDDFSRVEKNRKMIVILEDIDSLIEGYGEVGYLAMLDSAKSVENVLFIATTNYPDKLDPRIYNRPGRFSHVIKVGYPTAAARAAYLKANLKNHRDVETIVSHTSGFTIDHLIALINAVYREKKELLSEIERLKTLFNTPKSDEYKRSMGIGAKSEFGLD